MNRNTLQRTTARGSTLVPSLGRPFGKTLPVTFRLSDGAVTLLFGTSGVTASGSDLSITVCGSLRALSACSANALPLSHVAKPDTDLAARCLIQTNPARR